MACQIRMRTVCRTGMGTASQCVLLCQFMCKVCATELDLAERGGWQRQRDRQVVEGAAHVELQQVWLDGVSTSSSPGASSASSTGD